MGGFGRGKVWLRVKMAVGKDGRGRRQLWAEMAVGRDGSGERLRTRTGTRTAENGDSGRGRPKAGAAQSRAEMRVGQPWCGNWSLAIGACGQGRGRPWAWRSVGGLFVGVDGICRWVGRGWGRPWASAAVGVDGQGRRSTSSLSKNKV